MYWFNQVGGWLRLISHRAMNRESVTSAGDLVRCSHAFTREYNRHTNPFLWVATARSITDKSRRIATRISDWPH